MPTQSNYDHIKSELLEAKKNNYRIRKKNKRIQKI